MTPACFQHRNDKDFPLTCPMCDHLGHHEHMFWGCPQMQEILGERPEPKDALQRRYGLPTGDLENDTKVMSWMRRVVVLIWERRYKNETTAKIDLYHTTIICKRLDHLVGHISMESRDEVTQ